MSGNSLASLDRNRPVSPAGERSRCAAIRENWWQSSRLVAAGHLLVRWLANDGRWWGTSLVLHFLLVIVLGLILGASTRPAISGSAPGFETTINDDSPTAPFELANSAETVSGDWGDGDESAEGEPPPGNASDAELVRGGIARTLAGNEEPLQLRVVAQATSTTGPVAASLEGVEARFLGLTGAGVRSGGFNSGVIGSFAGRGKGARGGWLGKGGGSAQSENAVARGLRWLAAHQSPDGSWHFDLEVGPCEGRCHDSGTEPSTTAATSLALLAFLGHGETDTEGDYQEQVRRGLYYLTGRMRDTSQGGDFREGTMYAQGLSAMALAEACALCSDRSLEGYAQKAVDFIVAAQDKKGGGWRYEPQMPGDTTVTGWQLLALKSAQLARLRVATHTLHLAMQFLDSVQYDRGARYTYQPPKGHYSGSSPRQNEIRDQTTTSVGLLCRIYGGWPRDHAALREGVAVLAHLGPSRDDLYYDYYATQVMHHFGGEQWQDWNSQLRDYLVTTQASQGHESGSWNFHGGQAGRGGRLYNTAMATMTLEVYYRHLPLYEEQESKTQDRKSKIAP